MVSRRHVLAGGAACAAAVVAPTPMALGPGPVTARRAEAAKLPNLRKWAVACPTPGSSWPVIDLRTSTATTLDVEQSTVSIHPDLPPTTVWSYVPSGTPTPDRSTYLGPTLLARRGTPVQVTFRNRLPTTPLFPTDPTLVPHGTPESRINTHLHGGRIADRDDGNPFAAYADPASRAPEVQPGGERTHTYANEQGAALLWYHDHALGTTRTNVYAGLAGAYLLTEGDSTLAGSNLPGGPSGVPDPYGPGGYIPLHVPLVLQDKVLDAAGRLVYPHEWVPEFFGDTCLVNGKAFPYLDVQSRKYRFTFLNGSQSRFYHLVFNKKVGITQIGVELGFLEQPVDLHSILLGPAERADVIIDFSGLAIGTKVVMLDGVLPSGVVSPTRPIGDCMQFRVVGPALAGGDPFAGPPVLPPWTAHSPTPRPGSPTHPPSKVTLEEVMGRGGKPVMAVVNGAPFMTRDATGAMTHVPDEPFMTEVVANGSTVDWLYLNLTADSHPFHTHLAHFEVIDRQPFDAASYLVELEEARAAVAHGRLDPAHYPEPETLGPAVPAPARERGPKDTVIANPGEITRIRLRVDLPTGVDGLGRYVYHCHILEHEENEMMRPLLVDGR